MSQQVVKDNDPEVKAEKIEQRDDRKPTFPEIDDPSPVKNILTEEQDGESRSLPDPMQPPSI